MEAWVHTGWIWIAAAGAMIGVEMLVGTQSYLLVAGIATAVVGGSIWAGWLTDPAWASWKVTLLVWCIAAGAACAVVWRVSNGRSLPPDPNAPMGRTAAVAGYEEGDAAAGRGER